MQHAHTTSTRRFGHLLARALAGTAALLALVAGCGGGVGSGGTGTYASGPITGYGSIIVNDVRYDETSASVLDDDDGVRSRAELRLGMTVAIDSDSIRTETSGRAATASRVRIGSEIVAPVGSVSLAAGTFSILGQTVRVAADTVFDERLAGGLSGLAPGAGVEVYALYDAANGRYNATRVEPRAGLSSWTLRGPVGALDSAARTLRIGSATFAYGSASGVPADLAPGSIVRLRLLTAPDASGRYVVASFGAGVRTPDDRDEAELEGLITAFTSTASFRVNGLPVDASAASFPNGSAGLRLGARVQARGTVVSGLLRARTVEVKTEQQVDDRGFELKGTITAVNVAAKTFTLRGETVSWARADLRLEGGTLADLVVNRKVEVEARPNADRTLFEATKIKFDS